MFETLKVVTADNIIEDTEALFADYAIECIELSYMRAELKDLNSTLENLNSLYETIKTDGISKSLLAFVDKDGILSKNIPALPSLEALHDNIPADSCTAALEGIGNAIASILQFIHEKWVKFMNAISDTFESRARVVRVVGENTKKLHTLISGKSFSTDKAEKITGKFMKSIELFKHIDLSLQVHEKIMPLLKLELPTTREEAKEFNTKFAAAIADLREDYYIESATVAYVTPKFKKESLTAAGYDQNSFDEIFDKLEKYFTAFAANDQKLKAEFEAMLNHYMDILKNRSTVERLKEVGNAVTGGVLFQTTVEIVYHAAIKIVAATYDTTWHSYLTGPTNGVKMMKVLKKAYI